MEQLRHVILYPIVNPTACENIGVGLIIARGILLAGIAGTGKTRAVSVLADEIAALDMNCKVFTYYHVRNAGTNVYKLVNLFNSAYKYLLESVQFDNNLSSDDTQHLEDRNHPSQKFSFKEVNKKLQVIISESSSSINLRCIKEDARVIIFIDELDIISPQRKPGSNCEMVTTLLALLDGVPPSSLLQQLNRNTTFRNYRNSTEMLNFLKERIIIVAATNRINDVDIALRRPGRFDKEIIFKPPNYPERVQILKHLLAKADISAFRNEDIENVAEQCVGYVGADLVTLTEIASRLCSQEKSKMTTNFIQRAMEQVGVASSLRQTVSSAVAPSKKVTDVEHYWSTIAGYEEVKVELTKALVWPVKYKFQLARFQVKPIKGVLLYGPPGCAKTTFAKAVSKVLQFNSLNWI